jgi:hypothetical protein
MVGKNKVDKVVTKVVNSNEELYDLFIAFYYMEIMNSPLISGNANHKLSDPFLAFYFT